MATRTGRAFDFEIVAVVVVEFLERLDEEIIDRQPDRPAPIRIAAEDVRLRFARIVSHLALRAVLGTENVRMLRVRFAERAHAVIVHRAGDAEEMLEELRRDVFVNRILARELERGPHHVEAKHSHPARAIALLEMAAVRQGRAPIEDADVIETEEAALENIFPFGVFPVHPPGEGDEELVENGFEEITIAFARLFLFDFVNAPRGPANHRRIDVAEIPFVGGDLAIRVLVPFAQDDIELAFGELW